MRYVIAGSSGFLGTALRDALARAGHDVVRLMRSDSPSRYDSRWDPYAGQVDLSVVEAADVVVNLAGASLARRDGGRPEQYQRFLLPRSTWRVLCLSKYHEDQVAI